MEYGFDRFLMFAELQEWLEVMAQRYPNLLSIERYGTSFEGRPLLLATITDLSTGEAANKPAYWVDANIHSVEVTGGVAALWLINRLVTGYDADAVVTRALRTCTFYVAPRVNPDGVELALAQSPEFLRSATRRWPWLTDHVAPGLRQVDVDGDGRILTMRIRDQHGAWTPSVQDARIMAPIPAEGVSNDAPRYRLLTEGVLEHFDGFTTPVPPASRGLDLNRNFPAGWSTQVRGSGDHPLSEPEVDALVRAVRARPNICGYNAYHTAAGVFLRPSSTKSDGDLPPMDVWAWKHLGAKTTELTGYTVHSTFEDFTWDKSSTMSGAGDDWAYEHGGVHSWTTEFWDVIKHATGKPAGGDFWYTGPTEDQELAVLKWCAEQGIDGFVNWQPFDHPQLGSVEIGGWDFFRVWTNTPEKLLLAEVKPHAEFAIYQALTAPQLEIVHTRVHALGADTWRVEVGLVNTGFFPTTVTAHAAKSNLVLPLVAELSGAEVIGGPSRLELGQLGGRVDFRFGGESVGTPDRCLATWTVRAPAGTSLTINASHQRAGNTSTTLTLE